MPGSYRSRRPPFLCRSLDSLHDLRYLGQVRDEQMLQRLARIGIVFRPSPNTICVAFFYNPQAWQVRAAAARFTARENTGHTVLET